MNNTSELPNKRHSITYYILTDTLSHRMVSKVHNYITHNYGPPDESQIDETSCFLYGEVSSAYIILKRAVLFSVSFIPQNSNDFESTHFFPVPTALRLLSLEKSPDRRDCSRNPDCFDRRCQCQLSCS